MAGDTLPALLLLLSVLGPSLGCLQDPAAAYRLTGVVCRLTHPAAAVLNDKTTKVIEAVFHHARYPSVKREKSLLFIGKVKYGLDNLEIHNLTIGRSAFQLLAGEGIAMEISNVSALFKGTIQYGYGSWLVNTENSVDFEIDSRIDLGIKPKLSCGKGKIAADTSDCFLNFHKLRLHLQGDKQPNWLKKLFTDFVTFTVKLLIKGQICKEINKMADILAHFIQDTAEQFLSDGDIRVDIGVTAAPVITDNYIESYHKGATYHNNTSAVMADSVFHPSQLTEHRMLYFWLSDQVINRMMAAAHDDRRIQMNVSGAELQEVFKTNLSSPMPEYFRKCVYESDSPALSVSSTSAPLLNTSTVGTTVWVEASARLHCGSHMTPLLFSQMNVVLDVSASYAEKKVVLEGKRAKIFVHQVDLLPLSQTVVDESQLEFLREAVERIGVPKVLSIVEDEVTRLLDKQGTNLFDIYNPEVLPQDGFQVIQMDFGFPHHLLMEFLKKTLQ